MNLRLEPPLFGEGSTNLADMQVGIPNAGARPNPTIPNLRSIVFGVEPAHPGGSRGGVHTAVKAIARRPHPALSRTYSGYPASPEERALRSSIPSRTCDGLQIKAARYRTALHHSCPARTPPIGVSVVDIFIPVGELSIPGTAPKSQKHTQRLPFTAFRHAQSGRSDAALASASNSSTD